MEPAPFVSIHAPARARPLRDIFLQMRRMEKDGMANAAGDRVKVHRYNTAILAICQRGQNDRFDVDKYEDL